MESRFTNLLNRFESFVDAGNGPVSDPSMDRFEQLLIRLENNSKEGASAAPAQAAAKPASAPATSAPASSSGPASSFVPAWEDACFKNMSALLDATDEQGNEHLKSGVDLYLDLLNS